MSRYFVQDTPLSELEREMMQAPNFTPRRSGRAPHCRPSAADVDCRNCLEPTPVKKTSRTEKRLLLKPSFSK